MWDRGGVFRRRLPELTLFLGLALMAAAWWSAPGRADAFGTEMSGLASPDFSRKLEAIASLGGGGDERAAAVLQAMLDGDLFILKADDRIVLADRVDRVYRLTDPLTGLAAGEAVKRDLKKIRVNNRLRGALRAALGGLNLLNPDPEKRRAAAEAVLGSRDPGLLPALGAALARETEPDIRERMALARAAIWLATDDLPDDQRLAAIEFLGGQSAPEIRAMLAAYLDRRDGLTPELRLAAENALADVDSRLALWEAIGKVFQGISLGSVLLLAAIGLAVTFGVMGVINMAHGELVMLGAYTTYVVQEAARQFAPAAVEFAVLAAVPAAFLVSGAFGVAIERGIIRHLYGRPLETLLATWGLSLILQQLVRTVFGPTNREVANPSWMSGAMDLAGGVVLTYNRIWIILFALAVLAVLALILRRTNFGLQVRAITQNRRMAASMGIRTGRADALTFGLGAGIAGVAGVALSQIDNVSPNLGQAYIVDSFMVVVFGGVGNLWGTLVGAFGLGIVNKLLEPWAGAVLAKILVLVAIILFIQKRPRGLFALRGRAAEG